MADENQGKSVHVEKVRWSSLFGVRFVYIIGAAEQFTQLPWSHYTPKNKVSLLASIVPKRTFNIHKTFPLHKIIFRMEKGSLDF